MSKDFKDYFSGKPVADTDQSVDGDEHLLLRGGEVFRVSAIRNQGIAGMSDNTDVTAITVTDQWESLAGTMAEAGSTANLVFAANQYTFIGSDQVYKSRMVCRFAITKEGAGPPEDYELGIGVNGSPVGVAFDITADDSGFVDGSAGALEALNNGDVIEILIRNRSGLSDVTVRDAFLEIS